MTADWIANVACENCVAACCKAPVHMVMTAEEHKRHSVTMDLKVVFKPRGYQQRVGVESDSAKPRHLDLPENHGLFKLESGCANLDEQDRCTIYGTRPNCCRDFALRSPGCLKARRDAGLDADQPPLEEEEAADAITTEFFPGGIETRTPSMSTSDEGARLAPLGLAAVRTTVASEVQWLGERLAMCSDTEWLRQTRCAEWTVGDIAAHVTTVQQFACEVLTAALEGRNAKPPSDFEGNHAETIKAFGDATRALERVLTRLPVDTVTREVTMEGEAVGVQHLLEVLVMELAVHGTDLADALREPRPLSAEAMHATANALPDLLDPGVAPRPGTSFVLRSIAFDLPFTWRDNTWYHEAAEDACVIEGDGESLLLYALGRIPYAGSGLRSNRPDLARRFKRNLHGP